MAYKLFLFAVLIAGAQAATAEVSTRDFFKFAEFQEAELSPTGRYVAVTMPKDSRTLAAVIDLDSKEVKYGINLDENQHAFDLAWISDDRFVFKVAKKFGTFYARPVSDTLLYASNADGSDARVVYPPRGRDRTGKYQYRGGLGLVSPLLNEPDHLIIRIPGAYPDILRVDTIRQTARKEFINPLRYGWPLMTESGQVVGVTGASEDSLESVVVVPDGEGGWKEISRATVGQGESYPLGVFDGQLVLASSQETPQMKVVSVDPETGEKSNIYADDTYDVNRVRVSSDRKSLLAVQYTGAYPRVEFVNKDHPETKILAGLVKAFPDERVSFSDFSRDGRYVLVAVASDKNPGRFYRFDREKGSLEFLFARRAWINPEQMASRSPIKYKARDGLEIHGYLTLPADVAAEDLPLIVLPHGGPHGPRDIWEFDSEAQFFAHHGYAVLQVNFRGSGGYGHEFLSAGFKRWGAEMIDDVTDGALELVKSGIVDRDRMCIYGGSYGGYSALMGVVREPDLYQCAVGYVGVYDLNLMFQKGDIPAREEGRDFLKRVLGEDEEHNAQYSPSEQVSKIKADLFLVHGQKDVRAHYAHYTRLTDALDDIGKPYEHLVKKTEGHGFYDEDNRVELYDKMLAFFERNIGRSAPK